MSHTYTHGKRYHDEELRAKATCTLEALNKGEQHAAELVMVLAQHTRLHPQAVVSKIQELANIQL